MKGTENSMPVEGVEFPPCASPRCEAISAGTQRQDPLRRFTSTPYTTALPAMGRTVQLETNSVSLLEHAKELFAPYPRLPGGQVDFLWRIVIQSHPQMTPPWPKRSAFSDHGLRFAEFGQRNFLAVDLDLREGIAFLAEGLAEDKLGLTFPFLENMFLMSAGSLGLTSLRAACVALGHKGLLVFGPPHSGKTTASYVAAKLGLEFHADEGVFLELEAGSLGAWGGFWPIAFRPDALQFLPELRGCARPFSYLDFTFYHVDRPPYQHTQMRPVTPVCCVFLERQTATIPPCLSPLSGIELSRRLAEDVLFKDDDRFADQQAKVLNALERVPAYHLAYGSDPAVAAPFFQKLLMDQDISHE
jgi:hypothetical protein